MYIFWYVHFLFCDNSLGWCLIVQRVFVCHWCSQVKIVVHIIRTDQMPSLKMKTKLNMDSSGEKSCLSVCQKSSMISKKSGSHVAVSRQTAECDAYIQKCQNSYGKKLNFTCRILVYLCQLMWKWCFYNLLSNFIFTSYPSPNHIPSVFLAKCCLFLEKRP